MMRVQLHIPSHGVIEESKVESAFYAMISEGMDAPAGTLPHSYGEMTGVRYVLDEEAWQNCLTEPGATDLFLDDPLKQGSTGKTCRAIPIDVRDI